MYTLYKWTKNSVVIIPHDDHNKVNFHRSGILVYKWVDKLIDDNSFSRQIGRKEFIFKNNQLFLFQSEKSVNFIAKLNRNKQIIDKILTLDIETYVDEGVHIPCGICWFDGHSYFSYFVFCVCFVFLNDLAIFIISFIILQKFSLSNKKQKQKGVNIV